MCQKNPHEKRMQRALIQYRDPANYDLVVEALRLAHRIDLIGFDKNCLVRPRMLRKEKEQVGIGKKTALGRTNQKTDRRKTTGKKQTRGKNKR